MEIFKKKLTKTDVGTRFSMKTGSLLSFPRFERGQLAQVLFVEDESGENWRFHLPIRGGKYKKPVLSGKWLKFVEKKKLQIGDEVIQFFKEKDEARRVKYRIGIRKAVKLFNAVIGYSTLT